MRSVIAGCLGAAAIVAAGAALAAGAATIIQKQRAFSAPTASVAKGAAVTFDNEDRFIHQIYVDSPNFTFESDEQPPGTSVNLTFTQSGTFEVRCRIHPKMLVTVDVH